jgi:archaellum component FlaC
VQASNQEISHGCYTDAANKIEADAARILELEGLLKRQHDIIGAQSNTVGELEDEVERLREALQPFSTWWDEDTPEYVVMDFNAVTKCHKITNGDLRNAAKIMEQS